MGEPDSGGNLTHPVPYRSSSKTGKTSSTSVRRRRSIVLWRREGERPSTNKKTARRRSHQVNVRREGVCSQARASRRDASKPAGCIQGKGGIVVPDFEGSKVFNNLHVAHQSATGADR